MRSDPMNEYISNTHHASRHTGEYVTRTLHPVTITDLRASRILDSRGYPTVRVHLTLTDGTTVTGDAPAGASTGAHEAVELRDGGDAYAGRDVSQALLMTAAEVAPLITGRSWVSITELDAALAALDGTAGYSRLGANTVVATSIAMSRAFAAAAGLPLWRWIADVTGSTPRLPVPHFNVLNGGAHAANALDFQEFMIAPVSATSMVDAVRVGSDVYHALSGIVRERFGAVGLGDEGGFAPAITSPEEALDLLVDAIRISGHDAGVNAMAIALDPAANEFALGDGTYRIVDQHLDRDGLVAYYERLVGTYPIRSIEDSFSEDDHAGWKAMNTALGSRLQIVGDDLYVTDPQRIRDGGRDGLSNAALIKPNQIGTVSQTLDAIRTARELGMRSMVSHRSGETTDAFIADLVVGTGTGQIKSGAPARGERVAKYNRLTEIEETAHDLPYGLA
ncbi:phosphopyruvate hydratase [Clavibacter michiganensis]|uniref:phosphopyruvate hydratase n=1 Tax=Clavibacter michiganensis TaxID=28447 RepID=UPI00375715F6